MAVAAAATATLLLSLPVTAETDDAIARLLAETTSQRGQPATALGKEHQVVPADRPRPEDERQLFDEIEMLERARAEAEARRAAPSPSGAETAADTVDAAAARQREEDHRLAEEQRQAEESRRADATRLAAEAQHKADEERRVAEERQRTEDADYARMEAERDAEAIRIDAALQKAREVWRQRRNARALDEPKAATEPEPIPAPPLERAAAPRDDVRPGHDVVARHHDADVAFTRDGLLRASTNVTILIVLEPGDRGIRRHNKTADPLLCGEKGCYVGTGAGTRADFLPRHRALGAGRTLGERAGACRNSLGCVFRGVDLVTYPAVVQPIDMRLIRHDRREPHVLNEASRCRLDAGRLACTPVLGPDYVMWVVPEQIAERAGARELARVVEAGLRSQSASVNVRD